MARPANRLNERKSEFIDKNFLEQNPDTLPDSPPLVITNCMPEYKRVVFVNNRDPGVALHFHYASKTHPLKQYTLYDGFEHELPVEVIEHLEGRGEAQYGYRKSVDGHPEMYVKGYKYIFSFRQPKKIA